MMVKNFSKIIKIKIKMKKIKIIKKFILGFLIRFEIFY